jgi:phenylpropionate dioxygenase-like ring-hydroxylating dioxygenase large terminal subunit
VQFIEPLLKVAIESGLKGDGLMTELKAQSEYLGIDISEVENDLQNNRGLPLRTYFEPRIHEFELDAIFSSSWQYFAPLDQLAHEGDVVSGLVGSTPVVVTRAADGELHGVLNICRHRGYPVVEEGTKNCRLLRCKYHSWAYDLTGQLIAARDTESEVNFDKACYSLSRVSVDTWGALVFVNPNPDAPPLRSAHPNLSAWVEEEELDDSVDRYSFKRAEETDQRSNWKLWQENNFECYHCATIHGSSFAAAFATKDGDYSLRFTDRMTIARYKGLEPNGPEDLDGGEQYVLHFFPGCSIIQQKDLMVVLQIIPTGPESCRLRQHYFIEVGVPVERFERWVDIYLQTFHEDAEAAEKQQLNLRANRNIFQFVNKREEHTIRMLSYTWDAYKAALG